MSVTVDGTLGVSKVSDAGVENQGLYDKENILGVVSESGGVPTGAIIESGSNANGSYIKYADGTLICKTDVGTLPDSTASLVLNNIFRGSDVIWTFPHAFPTINDYNIFGNTESRSRWAGVDRLSATQGQMRSLSAAEGITAIPIQFLAIGRWF